MSSLSRHANVNKDDLQSGNGPETGFRQIHGVALALAIDADGPLFGVLILGESGMGKSLLAIEAINTCRFGRTALIADDIVRIETRGRSYVLSPPQKLSGYIEARGIGPIPLRALPEGVLSLTIDLAGPHMRMPEPGHFSLSTDEPKVPLYHFQLDAPAPVSRLIALARLILVDKFADTGTNTQLK
ncbi:MAG: hypothetical protein AAF720_01250 [Pseudomonadota bacterium]